VPGSGTGGLDLIKSRIEENITVKKALLECAGVIQEIALVIIRAYGNGGKVFLFGNGGSAADAQHIAAELSGRLYLERAPLPAESLSVNTSVITAVGNDYSFDKVFARQLEANGRDNDVAIGISTSGDSKNVIEGIKIAKRLGMATIALAGDSGGQLGDLVDCCLRVPSKDTARIQECHIMVGHIVCELVERELFGEQA
jgi:D-sedoheptulose 7-phosphate isomerase